MASFLPSARPNEFSLRPYQQDSIVRLQAEFGYGKSAVLLVAPTGSGKTIVGCDFVKRAVDQGKRCLWVAHRAELIRQASETLTKGYRVRHKCIEAGSKKEYDPRVPVWVASVPTLARRGSIGKFDLLVIDEAHHATASTYRQIIENHSQALILGLTATPWRLTGRPLESVFGGMVSVANYPELIRQRHLVRPRVFVPDTTPDFSAVTITRGDYDETQAAAVMDRPRLVGDVLDQWHQHAANREERSTIIFACNISHSQHLVARFKDAGVSAEHLDGKTPLLVRKDILGRLASGETRVVSNVMILSEGFDCPRVSCVVVARPTASRTLYLQMVGRALRPCSEIAKRDCVILDHAGNTLRHGLVSEITSYELEAGDTVPTTSESRTTCQTCPLCHAVVGLQTANCECGYSFGAGQRLPQVAAGNLVEHIEAGIPPRDAPPLETLPASTIAELAPHVPVLQMPVWFDTYLRAIQDPDPKARETQLRSLHRAFASASAVERRACVEEGLLCERPGEWLDSLATAGVLEPLGLGCITLVREIRIPGWKAKTYYARTKSAVTMAPRDIKLRLAALLFATGVPENVERTIRFGFIEVHNYAQQSEEIARQTLVALGFVGEQLESVVDLVRQHEYILGQIRKPDKHDSAETMGTRFRKRLGVLWDEHLRLAECLLYGPIRDKLRRLAPAIIQAVAKIDEENSKIQPEDHCPFNGNVLMETYRRPQGRWLKVMMKELGQWWLDNPPQVAGDSVEQLAEANRIFAYHSENNPIFNDTLPFLHEDEAGETRVVPDPLTIRPMLNEALKLKTGEVAAWAQDYKRKAVDAVVRAVAGAANDRATCLGVLEYIEQVAAEVPDITLGEIYRNVVTPRRTPREVVDSVRRYRAELHELVRAGTRQLTKEALVKLVRIHDDYGHFEDALLYAEDAAKRFGIDAVPTRLMSRLRGRLEIRVSCVSAAGGAGRRRGSCRAV